MSFLDFASPVWVLTIGFVLYLCMNLNFYLYNSTYILSYKLYIHIYTYIFICIYIFTYVCVNIYICIYVYMYIFIFIYVCVYIYKLASKQVRSSIPLTVRTHSESRSLVLCCSGVKEGLHFYWLPCMV